ncbi:unnamed protein product [Rhizoctonia solani]|uniref:F-box domain-containing protein n=1 Tax=Rhizoctonia solani TaxID=456999 RepID=A0A8H3AFU0_9AGAM|nr:unnamed protein product [Rhizoctonia solani]
MDSPPTTNELKRQVQELDSSQQSINSLPPEVLSHIFVLCEYADRPNWNTRNVPTRGHPNSFYQTTLPAVCRFWRDVALDTTTLWSRITLSDPPPFRLSALYLSRSGTQAPLDIEIKLTEKHWDYSDSWTPEVHQALPFIVARGGCTSRWRSCWIQTNDLPAHLATLNFLLSSDLSMLQYLDLDYCGPEYSSRRLESGVYSNFISTGSLFYDPPISQLQMAVLRSVPNACLFRHIGLFHLTELTYLELDFCSPLPELAQLNGLLAACPRLTALYLDSMLGSYFGSDPDQSDEPVELPKVCLPMLRSLALKHTIRTSVLWELGILKMIDAPNVQSLQLYLTSNRVFDSNPIVEYLTQGDGITNPGPVFPLLASLGFFLLSDITPDLRRLLSTCARVTTLVLPEFPELTALLETPWLAPDLALLSLETKDYEVLKKLIVLRRDAHFPIKTVELKKQTGVWEISPDEQKELEGLVNLVMVDELEDRMSNLLMIHTDM